MLKRKSVVQEKCVLDYFSITLTISPQTTPLSPYDSKHTYITFRFAPFYHAGYGISTKNVLAAKH